MRSWHRRRILACLLTLLSPVLLSHKDAHSEEETDVAGLFRAAGHSHTRDTFAALLGFSKFNASVPKEERAGVLVALLQTGRANEAGTMLSRGVLRYLIHHGEKDVMWPRQLEGSVLSVIDHPDAGLRRLAFNVIYDNCPESFEAAAILALFDESEAIRKIAVTQIAQRSEKASQVLGFYVRRSLLTSALDDGLPSVQAVKQWLDAQNERHGESPLPGSSEQKQHGADQSAGASVAPMPETRLPGAASKAESGLEPDRTTAPVATPQEKPLSGVAAWAYAGIGLLAGLAVGAAGAWLLRKRRAG